MQPGPQTRSEIRFYITNPPLFHKAMNFLCHTYQVICKCTNHQGIARAWLTILHLSTTNLFIPSPVLYALWSWSPNYYLPLQWRFGCKISNLADFYFIHNTYIRMLWGSWTTLRKKYSVMQLVLQIGSWPILSTWPLWDCMIKENVQIKVHEKQHLPG